MILIMIITCETETDGVARRFKRRNYGRKGEKTAGELSLASPWDGQEAAPPVSFLHCCSSPCLSPLLSLRNVIDTLVELLSPLRATCPPQNSGMSPELSFGAPEIPFFTFLRALSIEASTVFITCCCACSCPSTWLYVFSR